MSSNPKTVYIIASLHASAPTYRLYDHDKASDLLLEVRKQWPEHEFWLGKKEVKDGHYMGTN